MPRDHARPTGPPTPANAGKRHLHAADDTPDRLRAGVDDVSRRASDAAEVTAPRRALPRHAARCAPASSARTCGSPASWRGVSAPSVAALSAAAACRGREPGRFHRGSGEGPCDGDMSGGCASVTIGYLRLQVLRVGNPTYRRGYRPAQRQDRTRSATEAVVADRSHRSPLISMVRGPGTCKSGSLPDQRSSE